MEYEMQSIACLSTNISGLLFQIRTAYQLGASLWMMQEAFIIWMWVFFCADHSLDGDCHRTTTGLSEVHDWLWLGLPSQRHSCIAFVSLPHSSAGMLLGKVTMCLVRARYDVYNWGQTLQSWFHHRRASCFSQWLLWEPFANAKH